jgi:hypothetical protein
MKLIAVLLASSCLVWSVSPLRAAPPAPDQKAAQRALEQERKAMEAEIKRQQQLEKTMMEQQKKAMQAEIKAEQKFMEQQQKAYQQQQKANNQQPHPAPVYHASRPYYGQSQRRTPYRHYRQMPTQVDPETLALHQLKKSLDAVKTGATVTSAERTAIKSALMRVVEVPKTPTVDSVTSLAGHLAEGLAHRESTGAETAAMALTLRGVMNSTELPNLDLTEIMNEHRAALKASKVQTTHVTSIMNSLKSISNQERAHR